MKPWGAALLCWPLVELVALQCREKERGDDKKPACFRGSVICFSDPVTVLSLFVPF